MATTHAETVAEPAGLKVLSVSEKNPKHRTVQITRPEAQEASFLKATLTGLGITIRHFGKNFFRGKGNNDIETIEYPEEPVKYPERNRGLHRLMLRDDGRVRCVACMCCPTVCPANCITIVPAETDDKGVEKYPAVFEIDELRCIVCGLCVEACPCDAIRMDTGAHALPVEERGDAIMTKEMMMALSEKIGDRSVATQGGKGSGWREG